ncbi:MULTISPECIES: DUF58 domain-containing protein [Pyrobaculum]|uniref:DUF58 domain-containing protein n=1 Tax=Pyrobaculum TaxID=2276 RepID=UPI0023EF73C6|nr:DUF58 domain-containing protein [Pyrobaculum aerophilum]MCX8137754.1 DUF58 domain-containing protein [Pyrobaculum aerophilum]
MITIKLHDAYLLARKASPVLYIVFSWPATLPIVAALLLLALEFTAFRRVHTAAVYAHYIVAALMPPPLPFIFSTLLIPLLHIAKTIDNTLEWRAHAVVAVVATAANMQLVPLVVYTLTEAVWYYIKFARDKPVLKTEGRLEAVAGKTLKYVVELRVKGPATAKLPDGREILVRDRVREVVKVKYDVAGVYRPPVTLTYLSPTRAVKYVRQIAHPPIRVIPRVRHAVEIGERILENVEPEEVSGAREYSPGDPLRFIHWKKTAKLLRLVVKVLEGVVSETPKISVLLYATNAKALDRVLERTASILAASLTKAKEVEVIAFTRRGAKIYKASPGNYREIVEKLIEEAEVLDVEIKPAIDYARVFPKLELGADLLIGEKALAKPLCAQTARCVCV